MARLERRERTDDAFRALAHPARRELLCLLHEADDDVVSISSVGDHLATVLDASAAVVETGLRHVHLPALQTAGFVEYDERSDAIRYRGSDFVATVVDAGIVDCSRQRG